MDLIAILSTVILLVTIGTITVAIAAYAALKLRDKRKPKAGRLQAVEKSAAYEPVFLTRYMPPSHADPAPGITATPDPLPPHKNS
jgi:hypothetical protein